MPLIVGCVQIPGCQLVSKELLVFFGEAYNKAASVATAVNGFKAAGIWPVDPSVISEDEFAPSDVTERPLVAEQSVEQPSCNSVPNVEPPLATVATDISASGSRGVLQTNDIPSCSGAEPELVKAATICPVPVRAQTVSNRRSTLGATILTSSPYKISLEEKLKKKKGIKAPENKAHDQQNDKRNKAETQNEGKPKAASMQRQQSKKRKKTEQPVNKKEKSKDKQVTRSGVIKPPKPLESRSLLPRKPTWLQQKNNLGGLL